VGEGSSAVAEIVAIGEAIRVAALCVEDGVGCTGGGVNTVMLNVQAETIKLKTRRNAEIVFIVEPYKIIVWIIRISGRLPLNGLPHWQVPVERLISSPRNPIYLGSNL